MNFFVPGVLAAAAFAALVGMVLILGYVPPRCSLKGDGAGICTMLKADWEQRSARR